MKQNKIYLIWQEILLSCDGLKISMMRLYLSYLLWEAFMNWIHKQYKSQNMKGCLICSSEREKEAPT